MGSTHTLLTPTVIARESLMRLKNHMVMGSKVHRGYTSEFKKIGSSLVIPKPVKFQVTSGRTRATSTITENSITLSVSYQKHVSWAFNSADLALTIDRYNEKYVNSATLVLANTIDADLLALYKDVYNEVWESTGFVSPETYMVMGKAGQRMDEEAAPQENRCIVFNPAAHWSMSNAMKNMFVTRVSQKALEKGYLATIANMDIYMDQNVKVHTTGDFHNTGSAAAILLATTSPENSTAAVITNFEMIHFKIVASAALRQGDTFTIAGVNAVNPVSGDSTGSLRQFVVTANATAAATATSSIVTVHIDPPLIHTGPYKTVDTIPAAGAAVSITGTQGEPYPINMAFHKNAFALVMVPLPKPHGVWGATVTDSGYSIRILKDYDINLDDEVCRLDILYGTKTLYAELATRIRGAEG